MQCSLHSASVHHIDLDVSLGDKGWRFTGFYGWPAVSERHLSWQLLTVLGEDFEGPWMCIGDFNEVLYAIEMKSGERTQWQMNNFRDAVDECGLRDVRFEVYEFTYDNGQIGEANRQCRLNRAMGNEAWFDLFPYAKLEHLTREWSDHAPIKLWLDRRETQRGRKKLIRFEQVWVGEDGCEEAIRRAWDRGGTDILGKLRQCGEELMAWKGVRIGKLMQDIQRKRR
ncbi:uncharacterized protein LOC141648917 [Silene latifolia]|uniref:uncharacterized protein LOC141648917 n=1 Tax=Silene latifolia TaxID=37657 RepID=UPI003D777EF0